mgnify:CR=1 FL=1
MARPKGLHLNRDAFEDYLKLSGILSMADLAKPADIPLSTIWALVNEDRGASPTTVRRLARGLGVRPGTLFPAVEGSTLADDPKPADKPEAVA